MAVHAHPVTVNALNSPRLYLTGWNFRETGGTASATVRLRKGAVDEDLIESIQLAPGQSVGNQYHHPIILSNTLVYVQVTGTGTVEGVLHGSNRDD